MKKYLRKVKEERAAATALVIITVLSFMMILTGVFVTVAVLRQSQLKSDIKLQKIYGQDVENANEIYNNLTRKESNILPGQTAIGENRVYVDSNNDAAIIPQGFAVSGIDGEQTIENGLVIYQTGEVNITDWSNANNIKNTYSQWVWVPVEDVTDMYAESQAGVALSGSTGVTTNKFSKTTTLGSRTITRVTPGDSTGNREPDVVIGNSSEYDAQYYGDAGFASLKDMAQNLALDYNEMLESVRTFGGFYIGRYELTGTVDNPTEKSGAVLANQNWYNLYKACKNLGKDNDNIETRMVWGNQWDEACKFINTRGDKVDLDNSTTYGNYNNSTGDAATNCGSSNFNGTTGRSEYWKVNNIYDLAGNCMELTQEARSEVTRHYRGVHVFGTYNSSSVTFINGILTTESSYNCVSSRPTLYIRTTESTLSSLEKLRNSGEYVLNKTTVYDSNGNKVVIPQGFKVASDSGINVTEGIVIEDNDIIQGIGNNRGNQYVWVPVGEGIKKNDGTTVNITCGRYTFGSNGAETLQQNISNYANTVTISSYYQELNTPREGTNKTSGAATSDVNTTALSLQNFYNSVNTNGGYYIARYEASYGRKTINNTTVEYALSKPSTLNSTSSWTKSSSTVGQLWNYVRQYEAARACRAIYDGNSNYEITTDLVNSYAWDTAILYIQKFSRDTDYSKQNSLNTSLGNTGRTDSTKDEKCKINDIASNTLEWTTEYSTMLRSSYSSPCVYRGGSFYHSSYYPDIRDYDTVIVNSSTVTFRPILY